MKEKHAGLPNSFVTWDSCAQKKSKAPFLRVTVPVHAAIRDEKQPQS